MAGRVLLLLGTVTAMAAVGACAGLAASLSKLPDVASLAHYVPHETTKIFDAKSRLIANVHGEENRVLVPLHDIPRWMQHAVIATEDADFYDHYGVNPKGIGRAVLVNVAEGGAVEGASTLTQQLAKNLFLDPSKNLPRKIAEAWLAIQIEHHFSKAQILEMYLNQIYWGHNAYGIEAAAQNYFGKSTRQLSLAESALLAGILRSPEYFSPYRNLEGARQMQRIVLERMVLTGLVGRREADAAAKAPLKFPGVTSYTYKVPYFTSALIAQLNAAYGKDTVRKGGLRVYTTIDMDMQRDAEAMLAEAVKANGRYNIHQGALVAIEPKTGYVRALVGGVDYKQSKFNRATQALRPPGSTFKPFVYLTAISAGYSPGSVVVDEPVSYPVGNGAWYSPNNYDRTFRGPITLRKALESSVNIVAVKLAANVGLKNVIKTARALGIESQLGENLSLPLGTSEVTPYEMAAAYSVLANDGMRNRATMVVKVLDRNGRTLENHQPKPQRVYDVEPVRVLNSMMQGVIQRGTGTGAAIGRPAAGKTGTTSDARDVWFAGYTPDMACVVWMGNDDNSRLSYRATGGEAAAPLWKAFMRHAHQGISAHGFPRPSRIVEATINRKTGKLTNPLDADAVTEVFVSGHEPREFEPAKPKASPGAKTAKPTPAPKPVSKPRSAPAPVLNPLDETLLEPAPDFPESAP